MLYCIATIQQLVNTLRIAMVYLQNGAHVGVEAKRESSYIGWCPG